MNVVMVLRADAWDRPGGDVVQMESTAVALRELGHNVVIRTGWDRDALDAADVVHLANLDRPHEILAMVRRLRRLSRSVRIVVSTIHHPRAWMEDVHTGRSTIERNLRPVLMPAVTSGRILAMHGEGLGAFRALTAALATTTNALRILAAEVDEFVALSFAEGQELRKLGIHADNISVVPNGLGPWIHAGAPWNERAGITVVGRIEERKRSAELAEVLAATGLPCVFVGSRNMNDKRTQRGFDRVLTNAPHVTYAGPKSREDVLRLLGRSRMHISASKAEVFPLVDLEALASGCAVITTTRSLSLEWIRDVVLAVEPGKLTPDIVRKHYDQMPVSATAKFVTTEFTWSRVAQLLEDVYLRPQRGPFS